MAEQGTLTGDLYLSFGGIGTIPERLEAGIVRMVLCLLDPPVSVSSNVTCLSKLRNIPRPSASERFFFKL